MAKLAENGGMVPEQPAELDPARAAPPACRCCRASGLGFHPTARSRPTRETCSAREFATDPGSAPSITAMTVRKAEHAAVCKSGPGVEPAPDAATHRIGPNVKMLSSAA